MKRTFLFILLLLPLQAIAQSKGEQGFQSVRQCVMQNDLEYCHSIITPESAPLYDKFSSYKLMPCLPTDFNYVDETTKAGQTTVKATTSAGGGKMSIIRLIFTDTPQGTKLDIPATFRRGLGENWQNKVDMSEQIYLMMRQNMGNKLNCDMLSGLLKPQG